MKNLCKDRFADLSPDKHWNTLFEVGEGEFDKEGIHILQQLFDIEDIMITQDGPLNRQVCNVYFKHRSILLPLSNLTQRDIIEIYHNRRALHRRGYNKCCTRNFYFYSTCGKVGESVEFRCKDRSQRSGQSFYPNHADVLEERRRNYLLHKSLNDESILPHHFHLNIVLEPITYMGVQLPAVKDTGFYCWYKKLIVDFDFMSDYTRLSFLQIPYFWIKLLPRFKTNHWENIRIIKSKIDKSEVLCPKFIPQKR